MWHMPLEPILRKCLSHYQFDVFILCKLSQLTYYLLFCSLVALLFFNDISTSNMKIDDNGDISDITITHRIVSQSFVSFL